MMGAYPVPQSSPLLNADPSGLPHYPSGGPRKGVHARGSLPSWMAAQVSGQPSKGKEDGVDTDRWAVVLCPHLLAGLNYLIVRILQEKQKGKKGQVQLVTKQAPSSLRHRPQAVDPVHPGSRASPWELGEQ